MGSAGMVAADEAGTEEEKDTQDDERQGPEAVNVGDEILQREEQADGDDDERAGEILPALIGDRAARDHGSGGSEEDAGPPITQDGDDAERDEEDSPCGAIRLQ